MILVSELVFCFIVMFYENMIGKFEIYQFVW